MRIDGSCHCGKIAYKADIDPERVRLCHCTDCQELTGTAFRWTAPTAESDFHLLRGEPKVYEKTAQSGRTRIQTFCGDCGSPIYATKPPGEGPRTFGIRAGTIRQRRELAPRQQYWRASALDWVPAIECLETFDGDS